MTTLNQLSIRETLEPLAGARTLLTDKAGRAMGTIHTFGAGRAVRVAALPGLAYLNEAMQAKDYDPDSYLPPDYRPALREFIAWPARLAGAESVAQTSENAIEVTRYDKPGSAVLFLLNQKGTDLKSFSVSVPQAGQFTRARTASGTPVDFKKNGETVELTLRLNQADVVVLEN